MTEFVQTKTGGREATQGVIPGRFALSVGKPDLPKPDGWEWVKLTDVARLETGHTPSRKHADYWDGDIPWVGIKDATSNHGRVIHDTYQHVTQKGIDNSSARILPANTVCLSRTASVGYVIVIKKPMATSQDFVNWVCSEKIDYRYLAAILFAENSSFSLFSRGTTHQTIYFPEAKAFHVLLPPIEQQNKIADVIWSLNDKIELNRQINQTLEQIAQAIFKSWFVDFEPVKAKMAAKQTGASAEQIEQAGVCAISGKTPEQLAQLDPQTLQQLKTTAALFPDALVDSELGEMPEGWEVKTLEKLSSTIAMGPFGSNIKVETFVDEGVPIINGQQLKGTMLEDGDNKFLTYEHADKLIKSNVYRGDIVITHRGTLGQVSIIPEGSKYERYIVSQSQCYIRPDREVVSPLFMIYYFKSDVGQHELLAHKSQVGVPSIAMPVTNLRKIKLLAPSKVVSDKFQYIVADLQRNMSINIDVIYSLQELRDTLLPKLLSGELPVNPESPSLQEAI